jgi:hypothetical protein
MVIAKPLHDAIVGLMRLIRWFKVLIWGSCSLLWLPNTKASLIRVMDLEELVLMADQIAVVDVTSMQSHWDTPHRNIHTIIQLSVMESWKGSVPSNGEMTIRQLGGKVGDIEMTIHGMASFKKGERALVFLKHANIVGMGQGKRHVRWEDEKKCWMADRPEQSDLITIDHARPVKTSPIQPSDTLDGLRERIRALAGK